MWRITICLLLIVFFLCGCGCGKKSQDIKSQAASSDELRQIPKEFPTGPYKPTNRQIQTALKKAGYYKGEIDGAIGELTLEAVGKFQADNNLTIDGIVGPKTWALLSKYLASANEQDKDSP